MYGKIIRDIVPTTEHHRNSEGSFITKKNGDILFIYTRFDSSFNDDASADLYGMISRDLGETFSDPFPVLTAKELGTDNIMSVSLLRMENGDIGMVFLRKFGLECEPYFTRSSDEGDTWDKPMPILLGGYNVVNNDRIIRTSDGRILVPVARHKKTEDDLITPAKVSIVASDDDGRSWYTLSENIALPFKTSWQLYPSYDRGAKEPLVAELSGGRLVCMIRTALYAQFESFSEDGGKTWSAPAPSAYTSPDSPMSLKSLSVGGFLAVWNPVPNYNTREKDHTFDANYGRTPLVCAYVSPNGQRTGRIHILEDDKESGYCYTAIHETADGGLLLGYCAGHYTDGLMLNRLRIRKLKKSEKEELLK